MFQKGLGVFFIVFISLSIGISISLAENQNIISQLEESFTFSVQSSSGIKDEIDGISIDSKGNTIIGGLFSGKVKFGEDYKTAKKGSDMFIEKLDSTGKRLWFQQIDSGTNDFLWDLEVDSTGDIVISGGYGGTITFQSTYYRTSGPEEFRAYRDGSAFYAKLDGKNGNIKWIQTAGVPMKKEKIISNPETIAGGNEVKIDSKNNIIVTMMASGDTYTIGNQTYKKQGAKDAFIMKLDGNGKFLWSYQFGGDGSKQIRALATTGKDEIAFGHEYIGTIIGLKDEKFTTPSSKYPLGTFGMLSSSGSLLWMKGIESNEYTNIRGAGGDEDGNVYFIGQVQEKLKVDGKAITTTKDGSILVMKYNKNGKQIWLRIFGNDGIDGAGELAFSKDKKSFGITSNHTKDALYVIDETGKKLQSKLHNFNTSETIGALSVFDLKGNIISATSPSYSEQSTGGVIDGGNEGCFVYQMAFRGKLDFMSGYTYNTESNTDKDNIISFVCPEKEKTLSELEDIYGDIYMDDLSGKKGIILCFHGQGGTANLWKTKTQKKQYLEHMKEEGYSYVCPTSLDRKDKVWSINNTKSNPDVLNVDALLNELEIPSHTPLFLVGHSNGGTMVTRYSLFSERKSDIIATQYSNSPGLYKGFHYKSYTYPSVFLYSQCDTVVSSSDIKRNINYLKTKLSDTDIFSEKIDSEYSTYNNQDDCHEFLDTSKYTIPFFDHTIE